MIDDINFLKDNSVSDSHAFYIDSASRDQRYWPTPSEYSITFDQPFKFVVGFDILDAAIPTTQYNVSARNNRLALTLVTIPTNSGGTLAGIIPHITELARNAQFDELFESLNKSNALLITPTAVETYNIDALSLAQPDDTPYHAFTRFVLEGLAIRRKTNQHPTAFYFFMYDNHEYAINIDNTVAIDVISSGKYYMNFSESSQQTSIVYFTYYKLNKTVYDFLVDTSGDYIMNITNVRVTIEEGNYDISTLRNELNNPLNVFNVNFATTTPIETKQGRYKFTSSTAIIIFNGRLTTLRTNIGFAERASFDWGTYYTPLIVGDNPYVFMSVYDSANEVYKVEAPGLANLIGERFVILKITEIEDHLLGSYSYANFSPGIGIFKLASNFNDITNLRFDYVSLVKKPFHPIGKVTKLTLRFETSKGELYDFKSVDHQMLMLVKFLVPTQKPVFTQSVLNPNYDPDFIKYFAKNQTIRNKEESDEEDHGEVDFRSYKKRLLMRQGANDSESESESGSNESDDDYSITQALRQRTLVHS